MEVPRHWRIRKQRYSMVGEVCPHCETKVFPPRAACPVCAVELDGGGTLLDQVGAVDVTVLNTPLRVGIRVPVH